MSDQKRVKDLSVEELKEIIKEALIEALGVRGIEHASSSNEEKGFIEEEFRLTLFDEE